MFGYTVEGYDQSLSCESDSGPIHSFTLMIDPRLQAAVTCPFCRLDAGVKQQQVIQGQSVAIGFYCGRCDHEWGLSPYPVPRQDRRQVPDRRRIPRPDRRGMH